VSFRFKIAVRAERQIRVAAEWWAKNRTDTPSMFADDLESALALVEEFPHAGEAIRHPGIPKLRRVLLSRVQYHLYYTVFVADRVVEVLALWHTSRGRKPL
jgi:plasmid stabilization system protein ParE